MKRIKFLERAVFNQFGVDHPDNPVFEADQVEDMRDDQAERWLKRGKAELVEDLGPDELVIDGVPSQVIADVREQVEQRVEQEQRDENEEAAEQLGNATDALRKAIDDEDA